VPPLATREAVELFCARSGLEPSDEIAELCARLDSLPLAVELAAARTKALTVSQILERLSGRLDLLRGGRDADPRQQTLRATIEWSYELLSPEEQRLFARLSVFAGGCTLEAAEEVAGADLDTLQSLVEKSLLRFTEGRYWMLETIREFAGERLDGAETERRYEEYFVETVSRLPAGHAITADAAVMEQLEVESANLRSVLRRLIDQRLGERALELTAALCPWWLARGHYQEGLKWVEEALGLEGADARLRSQLLSAATDSAWSVGDLVLAREYATANLELAEGVGEPRAIAQALHDLAEVVTEERDFERAKKLYEEAIRRALEVGYPAPGSLGNLALIAFAEGDYARSRELTVRAMGIFRERNNQLGNATCLLNLACVALYLGDGEGARSSLRQSIGICLELRYGALSASCLLACAAVLAHTERERDAAGLLAASENVLEEMGTQREATEEQMYNETKARIRAALDESEAAAARQLGRALTPDDALSLALVALE
jgi:non-specific serine/threonine protein kinase